MALIVGWGLSGAIPFDLAPLPCLHQTDEGEMLRNVKLGAPLKPAGDSRLVHAGLRAKRRHEGTDRVSQPYPRLPRLSAARFRPASADF
jgi:hypothetical protein